MATGWSDIIAMAQAGAQAVETQIAAEPAVDTDLEASAGPAALTEAPVEPASVMSREPHPVASTVGADPFAP